MAAAKWSAETLSKLSECAFASTSRQRRELLKRLDDNDIICLVETLVNVLDGRAPISKPLVKALRPHARKIRKIANLRILPEARKVVVQSGGAFLAPLIPVIAGVLTTLISNALQ